MEGEHSPSEFGHISGHRGGAFPVEGARYTMYPGSAFLLGLG